LSIFIFVQHSDDYILAILLNSLSYLMIGLLSLVYTYKRYSIKIIVKYKIIKEQLTDGLYVFFSSISTSLYTGSSVVILGILTNPHIVGHYAAAEKIIQSIMSLLNPVTQSLFPYISKKFRQSFSDAFLTIKRTLVFVLIISSSMTIGVFVYSNQIVFLVNGSYNLEIVSALKALSFLPILVGISNILGIQIMLNLKFNKAFLVITLLAGIINIILQFSLVPTFQLIGTSISVVITEVIVLLLMFIFLMKKKDQIRSGQLSV